MTVIQFDTLECANTLKASGVSEEQANATIEVVKQALKTTNIATKQDVELETEKVRKEIEVVRKEIEVVRKEIEVVRKEIEVAKIETVKWIAGMFVAQTGILLAAVLGVMKVFLS